ncbi:MAG: 16S rRNA (adenine(1518)-N(6)/adenine(1519)-N(6))-dimethyltransferase RsmA [Eubacteriaceae bacterium]|nr:16S rRNA (adenine(1518)-N(6)/adenine(1519)-N(6))-dimethyltransferase RsmA [Eubacteriaceae bacterium]
MSQMKLYSHEAIKNLGAAHGFKMTKSLGQNFLTDKNIIDRIIDATGIGPDDLVIEIGPGLGVLTCEAARLARRVIAIEIDKALIPILGVTLGDFSNIEIINRDVLKTDITDIIEKAKAENPGIAGVKVIGNLPYYITTPIIMKLLEEGTPADSITVMMQKEVAERICAPAGVKSYGALSVAVQYYCDVTKVADVPKEVFVPRPKVDSAVLRLDVRSEKPVDLIDENMFFVCIKAGFSQRRKTLLNCMTGLRGMDKAAMRSLLEEIDIDPMRRAETLTIEEFAKLANRVKKEVPNG